MIAETAAMILCRLCGHEVERAMLELPMRCMECHRVAPSCGFSITFVGCYDQGFRLRKSGWYCKDCDASARQGRFVHQAMVEQRHGLMPYTTSGDGL